MTPVSIDVELQWNVIQDATQPVYLDTELQWSVLRVPVEHVSLDVVLQWNVEEPDQPQLNEDFILDVENALIFKIRGLQVSDERADGGISTRRVRAYFRRPQREITEQTFPYLTLELLRITRAASREMRGGPVYLPYTPKGYSAPNGNPANLKTDEMPIPLDFIFQITSHARTYEHDISIMEQMWADDRIPPRFGWLPVGPTWRYLDLLEGPTQADTNSGPGNKRTFRKVWTVGVSGELFQRDIVAVVRSRKFITNVDIMGEVGTTSELEWSVA